MAFKAVITHVLHHITDALYELIHSTNYIPTMFDSMQLQQPRFSARGLRTDDWKVCVPTWCHRSKVQPLLQRKTTLCHRMHWSVCLSCCYMDLTGLPGSRVQVLQPIPFQPRSQDCKFGGSFSVWGRHISSKLTTVLL